MLGYASKEQRAQRWSVHRAAGAIARPEAEISARDWRKAGDPPDQKGVVESCTLAESTRHKRTNGIEIGTFREQIRRITLVTKQENLPAFRLLFVGPGFESSQ